MKMLISIVGLLVAGQVAADEVGHHLLHQVRMLAAQYQASQNLDIARVISHSEIPVVCKVVPVEMEYEDSKGERHVLRYQVMGTGCLG
ncbi:DUF2790 domain-containing protein [Pseudomonas indica]|uniref:DUF2790 domain-containing protein n=1 Tax=Pseudomonas indica TaxID=137658 RepID=UPI000BCBD2E4|nr:DUF2790 domain-containing protein [Pseudomonas indica]PAU65189.1 hypothetical protein BZL42_00705 [Pseudomonas indica]